MLTSRPLSSPSKTRSRVGAGGWQRRMSRNARLAILACAILAFWLLMVPSSALWPSPNVSSFVTPYAGVKMSKVIAHAPGYTVVENLYWRNYTYYFLTDQPWHVPELNKIASLPLNRPVAPGQKAAVILALRDQPVVTAGVREHDMLGETTSFQEGREISDQAQDLPSPLFINNDNQFVDHYYHWIGEIFFGMWRMWSNLALRNGTELPEPKVIAFIREWNRQDAPHDALDGEVWQDGAGANEWFTKKMFPNSKIETKLEWSQRAETGEYYRLPLVLLGDRWGGDKGASASWKPFGDVLRLPAAPEWLVQLRSRILKGYKGPVDLKPHKRPHLMYLGRQDTTRRLLHSAHEALVKALKGLEAEGLIDYSFEQFTSATPFEDQVAKVSTVDILVAVHGNGLTHTLWMEPGPFKAVFEMQPPTCFYVGSNSAQIVGWALMRQNDYSPLAVSNGVRHYMTHGDFYCTPQDCGTRGCFEHDKFPKGIGADDIPINPTLITDEIRNILAGLA